MTHLNRKVEYALMALKIMHEKRPGELSSVKSICDFTGAPFDATSRVLQTLATHGILQSVLGPTGGYCLVKDLKWVSFFELSELVLGPMALAKCLKSEEGCDLMASCNIASPLSVLNLKLIEFYKSISLYEIFNPKAFAKPLDLKSEKLVDAAGRWK